MSSLNLRELHTSTAAAKSTYFNLAKVSTRTAATYVNLGVMSTTTAISQPLA
jgi:hypothetical protein